MGSVMEALPFRVEKAEGVFVVFKKELAHFCRFWWPSHVDICALRGF